MLYAPYQSATGTAFPQLRPVVRPDLATLADGELAETRDLKGQLCGHRQGGRGSRGGHSARSCLSNPSVGETTSYQPDRCHSPKGPWRVEPRDATLTSR
jgi:hypothetical protein